MPPPPPPPPPAPSTPFCVLALIRNVLHCKRNIQVILPSDFVVGDVEVDENGPLHGQVLDNEDGDGNEDGDEIGSAAADGGAPGGGGSANGEAEAAAVALDLEPEDPSMGFEYEGEARR